MTTPDGRSNLRRFSILDLLILVAATAPGLAVTRSLPAYMAMVEQFHINHMMTTNSFQGWLAGTTGMTFNSTGRPLKARTSYWLGHIPYWVGPTLVSWSIVALVLNLRGSRHGLRRAVRSPASVAGLAILVALVVQMIQSIQIMTVDVKMWGNFWPYYEIWWSYFWIKLPRLAGYTVAISWAVLALCRRWRAEPGARAKIGRALGWSWIALALSSELGVWCFALNC